MITITDSAKEKFTGVLQEYPGRYPRVIVQGAG